jgi:calcineurin-like phosphoesterase family protein
VLEQVSKELRTAPADGAVLGNSKEAKTFSRCCSRLMGRMIVIVGNENDLDYPQLRFSLSVDKFE